MSGAGVIEVKPLPPAEAIAFFRAKGYAISFSWRDIWKEEHAVAFTVAKAMRIDLLEDIRTAIDQAIANGITYNDFAKNLTPVLQAKGWWGRKRLRDPKTGKMVLAQLGSNRRLKIIFDTNIRMAYAAGRWQRIKAAAENRPYLRYVGVLDDRIREQHRTWHGTVRPVKDSFWDTHYPPNGWRCRCTVEQLSDDDLQERGYNVSEPPVVKRRRMRNRRTGRVDHVPEGISPGFDYNVGKARLRAYTPPPLIAPAWGSPLLPPGGTGGGDLPPNPPRSFPPGVALPPLPRPRTLPKSLLIDPATPDQDAATRFLALFGATPDRPALVSDKTGEPLTVGIDLFQSRDGRLKIGKRGRKPYLLTLAQALKEPDEIWWHWEKARDGRWLLRRRYLARFTVAGEAVPALTVFDWHQSGWYGVTTFPGDENYLASLRVGTLAYRRRK